MFYLPQRLDWLEMSALSEFKRLFDQGEWLASDDDEAADVIREIADYRTPFLPHEVLEVALFDPRLCKDTLLLSETFSEIWAIELIQTNIYLHLKEQLFNWYYKNKID